jgi:hypothetical protein
MHLLVKPYYTLLMFSRSRDTIDCAQWSIIQLFFPKCRMRSPTSAPKRCIRTFFNKGWKRRIYKKKIWSLHITLTDLAKGVDHVNGALCRENKEIPPPARNQEGSYNYWSNRKSLPHVLPSCLEILRLYSNSTFCTTRYPWKIDNEHSNNRSRETVQFISFLEPHIDPHHTFFWKSRTSRTCRTWKKIT